MNEHEERNARASLTAADVMTATPRTCSTFSTVLEAVMIFRDNDCGAVPILDGGQAGRRADGPRRGAGDR